MPEKDPIENIVRKAALRAFEQARERLSTEENEFYASFERLLELREEIRVKTANAEAGEDGVSVCAVFVFLNLPQARVD